MGGGGGMWGKASAKLRCPHVPFLCAATDLALGEELWGVKAWLWRKGKGLFSTTFSCGEVVSPGLGCQYPQGLGPVLWHQFSQLLPCHVVMCAVFLFGGMAFKPPGDGFRFPPCPVCANAVSLASLPPAKSRIH